jgi:hypothetical protein
MITEKYSKNLSVNNIYGQRHLTECDDCCRKVVKSDETAFEFLISNEELPEAIEPTVTDFHDPTPGVFLGVSL